MKETTISIMGSRKTKSIVETVAQVIFTVCALAALIAVAAITLYMVISGAPALTEVGYCFPQFGHQVLQTHNMVYYL